MLQASHGLPWGLHKLWRYTCLTGNPCSLSLTHTPTFSISCMMLQKITETQPGMKANTLQRSHKNGALKNWNQTILLVSLQMQWIKRDLNHFSPSTVYLYFHFKTLQIRAEVTLPGLFFFSIWDLKISFNTIQLYTSIKKTKLKNKNILIMSSTIIPAKYACEVGPTAHSVMWTVMCTGLYTQCYSYHWICCLPSLFSPPGPSTLVKQGRHDGNNEKQQFLPASTISPWTHWLRPKSRPA